MDLLFPELHLEIVSSLLLSDAAHLGSTNKYWAGCWRLGVRIARRGHLSALPPTPDLLLAFPRLEVLEIHKLHLLEAKSFAAWPYLRELELHGWASYWADMIRTIFPPCLPQIQSLFLERWELARMIRMEELPRRFPGLVTLHLRVSDYINAIPLRELDALSALSALTRLDLETFRNHTFDLGLLAGLTTLRLLGLKGFELNGQPYRSLLAPLTQLTSFTFDPDWKSVRAFLRDAPPVLTLADLRDPIH